MSDSEKTPLSNDVLIKAAKSTLNDQAASLSGEVRQRLQQARRTAVHVATLTSQPEKTAQPSKTLIPSRWLVPAGSFALLALAISVVIFQFQMRQDPAPIASIEDLPLLTAPEDLELYEELDFYLWLAEEHSGVG